MLSRCFFYKKVRHHQQPPGPRTAQNVHTEACSSDSLPAIITTQVTALARSAALLVPIVDSLLRASDTLPDVKCIHAHIVMNGLEVDPVLAARLIRKYCSLGAAGDALVVFRSSMQELDVHSWNNIIGVYSRLGHSSQTLFLFELMQQKGIAPDHVTFVQVLSSLDSSDYLEKGCHIHARAAKSDIESNIFVATALVSMYSKCGSLENARRVYERVSEDSVVCCNAMIAAYVQDGVGHEEPFHCFEQLQQKGALPDKATFIGILSVCAMHTFLVGGKRVHLYVMNRGFDSNIVVQTALVNMYGKCKNIKGAERIFEESMDQDIVAWNSLLSAYSNNNCASEALELFYHIQHCGMLPNRITFISVIDSLSDSGHFAEGKRLHAHIIANGGIEEDVVLGTALVGMYGRCGSAEDAERVFNLMTKRNTVTWSVFIGACAQHEKGEKALDYFTEMLEEGVIADKLTFLGVLDACTCETILMDGQHVHKHICITGMDVDLTLTNVLLKFYGKCGALEDVQRIFSNMSVQSVVSWNSLISAYSEQQSIAQVVQIFVQMWFEGVIPDKLTFLSILPDCTDLREAKRMHVYIIHMGLVSDISVGNALINMYGKCSSVEDACAVFDKLTERNGLAWNAMFAAYSWHECNHEILLLFQEMQRQGVVPDVYIFPTVISACASQTVLLEGKQLHSQVVDAGLECDAIVGGALVNMYGKCGSLEDARQVFNKMAKDVVAWNTMIAVYGDRKQTADAWALYSQMQIEGIFIGQVTFISMLSACANQSALLIGKLVHMQVMSCRFDFDVIVETALMTMYGKCGNLQHAQKIFDNMPIRNLYTWNALVSAYAQHGHAKETLHVLEQMCMQGFTPGVVTFVSVFSACSRAGLIDEACQIVAQLRQHHGGMVAARLYDSLVDLLARAGRVDDAERLIRRMPVQPNFVSWTSLIGACTNKGDADRGGRVVDHMLEIDPSEPAAYIMLSKLEAAI